MEGRPPACGSNGREPEIRARVEQTPPELLATRPPVTTARSGPAPVACLQSQQGLHGCELHGRKPRGSASPRPAAMVEPQAARRLLQESRSGSPGRITWRCRRHRPLLPRRRQTKLAMRTPSKGQMRGWRLSSWAAGTVKPAMMREAPRPCQRTGKRLQTQLLTYLRSRRGRWTRRGGLSAQSNGWKKLQHVRSKKWSGQPRRTSVLNAPTSKGKRRLDHRRWLSHRPLVSSRLLQDSRRGAPGRLTRRCQRHRALLPCSHSGAHTPAIRRGKRRLDQRRWSSNRRLVPSRLLQDSCRGSPGRLTRCCWRHRPLFPCSHSGAHTAAIRRVKRRLDQRRWLCHRRLVSSRLLQDSRRGSPARLTRCCRRHRPLLAGRTRQRSAGAGAASTSGDGGATGASCQAASCRIPTNVLHDGPPGVVGAIAASFFAAAAGRTRPRAAAAGVASSSADGEAKGASCQVSFSWNSAVVLRVGSAGVAGAIAASFLAFPAAHARPRAAGAGVAVPSGDCGAEGDSCHIASCRDAAASCPAASAPTAAQDTHGHEPSGREPLVSEWRRLVDDDTLLQKLAVQTTASICVKLLMFPCRWTRW